MIVFSAFVPHSPLLLPSIGKENVEQLTKTRNAMSAIEEELYAAMPDTVIVISSHNEPDRNAFSVNVNKRYGINLTEFGDYSNDHTFQPDLSFIDTLQRQARQEEIPITLNSSEHIDYGASVPLLLLTEQLPDVKIVPVSYSGLDPKTHLAFGKILKDIMMRSDKRIAVIASGDLSHCLSSDAPVEYNPKGAVFDETIQSAVKDLSTSKLLQMDEDDIDEAAECAYESLLILFGVLDRMNVQPKILSYEAPFGVGYLVAQFLMI